MSWQRIRGHENVIAAFGRAVERGRLAHAYLFVGPSGVGKRLVAGELAKALLCEGSAEGRLEACDRCVACRLVDAESHPDFFTAGRPADSPNLPIEVMRELCRGFSLKSARGKGKVAILDDADDLDDPITGNAAANCFLKTLEEPPPRSVFILVGNSIDRQLPTILSRCQAVRFRPVAVEHVDAILSNHGVDEKQRLQLIRLSGGSPGRALALADEALWSFRRTLVQALAAPRFDSVGLAKNWWAFAEEAGKESALQRSRASLAVGLLVELFDDALCLSVGRPARITEPDEVRALESLARRVGTDRLTAMLERSLDADAQIDRRVQLVLAVEAVTDALGEKMSAGSE